MTSASISLSRLSRNWPTVLVQAWYGNPPQPKRETLRQRARSVCQDFDAEGSETAFYVNIPCPPIFSDTTESGEIRVLEYIVVLLFAHSGKPILLWHNPDGLLTSVLCYDTSQELRTKFELVLLAVDYPAWSFLGAYGMEFETTCTTQELNGSEEHRLDHNPSTEKCPMSNVGTGELHTVPGTVAQAVGYIPLPLVLKFSPE